MVRSPRELEQALKVCRSEAQAAFGDDSLYLEKWLEDTRHVEVQVVVDRYGHGVHLGERDCSVQRRHQKILEEAPTPALVAGGPDGALRARRRGRRGGRLRERRHARVPRRRQRRLLLHRDQLPHPGRAPGDRDAHRHRPRRDPDPDRRRRAARASARPTSSCAATRSSSASTPRTSTTTSGRAPGLVERYLAPGGPGVRMDSHLYRRLRGPAVLRLAAGQAHRLGPRSRRRRSTAARAALDELVVDGLVTNVPIHRALLAQRGLPRRPDDHEPARPGRQRRVRRGGGAAVSARGSSTRPRSTGCRPAWTTRRMDRRAVRLATRPHRPPRRSRP